MRRRLSAGLFLLLAAGCTSIEESEAIRPLREHGPTLTYDELLLRARRQADLAMDRAFRNNWTDVQDVATALEQTVRLLPAAPQAPPKKEEVTKLTSQLADDAKKLNAAAAEMPMLTAEKREAKVKEVDTLLLTISRNVRTLWTTP